MQNRHKDLSWYFYRTKSTNICMYMNMQYKTEGRTR